MTAREATIRCSGDLTREEIEDALDAFERDLDENDHSGDNSM